MRWLSSALDGRQLPAGWTLEEIRNVSGNREATLAGTERVVMGRPAQDERIHLEIVLGFHELCLVKAVNDDDWCTGSLNDDGSITCWSAYRDPYEALRSLYATTPVPADGNTPSQFSSHSAPFTVVRRDPKPSQR
ncbi:hypothetical protein ACWET9_13320 [Streptomyces sp. NPDC004059]